LAHRKGVFCLPICIHFNDCLSHHESVRIFKFADDITVVGLITNDDEWAYRNEVSLLAEWCSKTKEMVVKFLIIEQWNGWKVLGSWGPSYPLVLNGTPMSAILLKKLTSDFSF